MKSTTKGVVIAGGLAALGVIIWIIVRHRGKSGKTVNPDELDNPMQGPYVGHKPRSRGNSATTTTTVQPKSGFSRCIPAMESEGGGMGKFISVDDPHTPGGVEQERRQIVHDNLNVGDTIDLDGRSCKIKK